ncbi:hypothetical protein HYW46_01890 [Candidatus Daviesbacteria bacterium]|nr:hypothetical protein [Candidatus Daviesbacteria bacterium]
MTESLEKQEYKQEMERESYLSDEEKRKIRQEVEDFWFGRMKRKCGRKGHACMDCIAP